MIIETLFRVVLILAAIPLFLGFINLFFYRALPRGKGEGPPVSVLVPARNESHRIKPVIASVLASGKANMELIVADDNSTDDTAAIIKEFARQDTRVKLLSVPPLPEGWMGKNHACHNLAQQASHELMIFLDADVTVEPEGLSRLANHMADNENLALLSGFPRQITGTFWEKLVIPLIHFVLLGFLPFVGMRFTNHPMFATACGQLIAVRREAYMKTGGHEAIHDNIHDGVYLPRRFRNNGFHTDLFDVTDVAATRMYENLTDLISGLMKNAHEGMATPVGLPVWTTLLGGGQILPPILLVACLVTGCTGPLLWMSAAATGYAYLYRLICTVRFKQSWLGFLLHPLGVAFLLWIQWTAFIRRARGITVSWKDRAYGGS